MQLYKHKEKHNGYSDNDQVFYVVCYHKQWYVGSLDDNVNDEAGRVLIRN